MKIENIRKYEKLLIDISKDLFIEWKNYWNHINIHSYKDLYKYYYNNFILKNEEKGYIFLENNNILGYGFIVNNEFPIIKSPKNSVFITDIFIKKKYRGNGLSKTLIHLLIIEAKKFNKEILIGVDKKTKFLHNLYKKFGFEFIEEIDYSDLYLIYKLRTSSI